mgnify:CR=1 FL=1
MWHLSAHAVTHKHETARQSLVRAPGGKIRQALIAVRLLTCCTSVQNVPQTDAITSDPGHIGLGTNCRNVCALVRVCVFHWQADACSVDPVLRHGAKVLRGIMHISNNHNSSSMCRCSALCSESSETSR